MTGLAVLPAADLAALMERERLLHAPAAGTDRADFEAGLTPGYWEVGASGGRFDVDVIWDVLVRRATGELPTPAWAPGEPEARAVGAGAWLLTYVLDQGERRTRRMTLWHADPSAPGGWRALYHQGTVVTGRW